MANGPRAGKYAKCVLEYKIQNEEEPLLQNQRRTAKFSCGPGTIGKRFMVHMAVLNRVQGRSLSARYARVPYAVIISDENKRLQLNSPCSLLSFNNLNDEHHVLQRRRQCNVQYGTPD